jgi:hypothetical protein
MQYQRRRDCKQGGCRNDYQWRVPAETLAFSLFKNVRADENSNEKTGQDDVTESGK